MPVRAAVVSMVLAGLALGFALAPPARAEIFNPETFTLDNGLQVVVLPNHRVPVVHHMVWYRVGAADEPPGKTGLSHLVEHMMFKGTETLGPNQFSRIVARNGGRDNAFASSDFTGYHQTIAKEHLEMVMGMEADRMVNLSLAEEDFLTELEVVREERRSRVDNEPSALLNERLDQALWVVHPYKNPIVGWEHELKSLTREDVLAFYKAHYGPENAIVVISGDVTAQEVQPLAEATYGQVPNQGIEPRMRDRSLPLPAEATITLQHAQVGQASLTRRYVAPSYNLDPEQDVYALQVFQEIVGSGSTGKLYRSLVIDQEIAVSAGAYYRANAVDWGSFAFYALPRPGVDIETLDAALKAEIQTVLETGLTPDIVDQAKARMVAGLVYERDSLGRGARTFGARLVTGSTIDDVESWPARIGAVTPDQIAAAVDRLLNQGRSVTGILLPDKQS